MLFAKNQGEVFSYTVRPFVPKVKISEQGNVDQQQINLEVGKIKIQSLPVSISISIPGLKIESLKKQDEWIAEDVPVGTYDALFSSNGKTQSYTIKVVKDQVTHIFVNMIKNEIEDRSTIVPTSQDPLSPFYPVKWNVISNHLDGKKYEILLCAKIKPGYYLFERKKSDDGPIPTSIIFHVADNFKLVNGIINLKKTSIIYENNFEMQLAVYKDSVSFQQVIELTQLDGIISGEINYMSSSKDMCTPPRIFKFTVDVVK